MAKATGFGGAVLRADDPGEATMSLAREVVDRGRCGRFTDLEGYRVASWQPFS